MLFPGHSFVNQTTDKVQNQALRNITGAMKSTPIQSMEEITNIPPLCKRRECKAMMLFPGHSFVKSYTKVCLLFFNFKRCII
jgi:hypothetical protein